MVVSSLVETMRRAPPKSSGGDGVQLATDFLADDIGAAEDGEVAQHLLAAIAEARRLDGQHVDGAAELVDDQRGEGLAVDVLGDDEDRAAQLDALLQCRQQIADAGDLLVGDEDGGVLQHRLHAVGVGHEVGADVAPIELHALGVFLVEADRLTFLDGDDTVLADLVHDLGDELADGGIGRGDSGHSRDLLTGVDRDGVGLEALHDGVHALVQTALDDHGVGAGGDVLEALGHERLAQHHGGGGAVTGDVIGLGGDFLEELRTHVLEGIFELHLSGDGDAVVGDGGGTELLVEDDVAALGTERHLDGIGETVDAPLEGATSGLIEDQLLGHGLVIPPWHATAEPPGARPSGG